MAWGIPLTQNQFAVVDSRDYRSLAEHKWYAKKHRYTYYAHRKITVGGKQQLLVMHRVICSLTHGNGKQTDHLDGNGLNNQRKNLRICSNSENSANQRSSKDSSSQYKGACWNTNADKWQAGIKVAGVTKYLGLFTSEIEAALAYNEAAKEHWGEYARLNDIKKREN